MPDPTSLYTIAERREHGLSKRRKPFDLRHGIAALESSGELTLENWMDHKALFRPIALVSATEKGKASLEKEFGDRVWIEPPRPLQRLQHVELRAIGDDARSLSNCRVMLKVNGGASIERRADADGRVWVSQFELQYADCVVVTPEERYWSTMTPIFQFNTALQQFDLPSPTIPIPANGLGWWHEAVGITKMDRTFGKGIRIGVIDGGCDEHDALSHAKRIGIFGRGNFVPDVALDDSHGTHVCGIIGARIDNMPGFWGMAPAADLLVATVPGELPAIADVARAISHLVIEHKADLINISFGGKYYSQVLRDFIEDASDHGCLCFCSAGNDRSDVAFPACLPTVVAVSAVGCRLLVPAAASFARCRLHGPPNSKCPDWVLAEFSCRGPEIGCCAPGVGIVSASGDGVNSSGWRDLSGTSMASPVACGTLAAFLSKLRKYNGLKGRKAGTDFAKNELYKICQSRGLHQHEEGAGMPQIP